MASQALHECVRSFRRPRIPESKGLLVTEEGRFGAEASALVHTKAFGVDSHCCSFSFSLTLDS